MLSHVMIGVSDIERSKEFYTAVLAVLGVRAPMVNVGPTGHTRFFFMHNGSTFSVTEPINGEAPTIANGSTVGFACDSPEQIKELHDVAIAHGGKSIEDPPGPRENSMGVMHLCYFTDPDGHKICGLYREPKA